MDKYIQCYVSVTICRVVFESWNFIQAPVHPSSSSQIYVKKTKKKKQKNTSLRLSGWERDGRSDLDGEEACTLPVEDLHPTFPTIPQLAPVTA